MRQTSRRQVAILGLIVGALVLAIAGCTDLLLPESARVDPLRKVSTEFYEVILDEPLSEELIAEISEYGRIVREFPSLNGVVVRLDAETANQVAQLPSVEAIGKSTELSAHDYSGGLSVWNLDTLDVTDYPNERVAPAGSGVYVAVLDTGLVKQWRDYFPEERIATDLAVAFSGGGGDLGMESVPPNKWERDTSSHGTHVTSSVLGFLLTFSDGSQLPVNGTAPLATVIPVKVLNNDGSGWSPMLVAGIQYVVSLTEAGGALEGERVVINMSLGGPALSPLEEMAIDCAISKGVVVVASAGNEGPAGMGYPGAYGPVISVGAAGWTGEFLGNDWWYGDVPDPTKPEDVYITDFSSRAIGDQDLDVVAPGSWILGPYMPFGAAHPPFWASGSPGEFWFLGGTSMAAPQVAGLVALMLEMDPTLSASEVESRLEASALPIPPGSRDVTGPDGVTVTTYSWGGNATGAGLVQWPRHGRFRKPKALLP